MLGQIYAKKIFIIGRHFSDFLYGSLNKALTQSRTAVDHVWRLIFSGLLDDHVSQRLRAMFPAEWWIESQGFSLIHRTILGLNPLELDESLTSVSKSMISSGDAYGRSPLWWTARRGDYSAMLSLLRYNADIHRPSDAGWSALSTAMYSKNQECVRLLLSHSPDLKHLDPKGWLALHHAAYVGMDATIISATIPPEGIDVKTLSGIRYTALMIAAQENHNHTCEYLLSLGADPNIGDDVEETALHHAIQHNSHRSTQLLSRYTHHHLKTKAEETFLHHAAQHSNLEGLKILCASDLSRISVKYVVSSSGLSQIPVKAIGLTALEIAEQKIDVTPEWLAMFHKLLHKVEFPDDAAHTGNAQTVEEEFHDAVEAHEA